MPGWMLSLGKPMTIEKGSGMDRSKEFVNPDSTHPEKASQPQSQPQSQIGFDTSGEPSSTMRMLQALKKRMDKMEDSQSKGFAKVTPQGLEGEELFEMLPRLGKKAVKLLTKPPKTWKRYLEDEDWDSIYEMEVEELKKAVEEGASSVDRELSHVMAALVGMAVCEME